MCGHVEFQTRYVYSPFVESLNVHRPAKTLKFVIRKMQDKSPKVQLLALELVDYATNACDIPFHT